MVADHGNSRLSQFNVETKEWQTMASAISGYDVQQSAGGWLVSSSKGNYIAYTKAIGLEPRSKLGLPGQLDLPSAMALVPDMGLVVRDRNRVQVYA